MNQKILASSKSPDKPDQSEEPMQIDSGDGQNANEVSQQITDFKYLEMLKDYWVEFCTQMQSVRNVFLYLERTYLVSP